MQFVLYFLVCLIATTVGAISGVGGGVVIKPVFDAVAGMSVSQVSFLSGCTVLAMTIVSLLRSRGEKIELKRGTLLAVGGAVGGLLGKAAIIPVPRGDASGFIKLGGRIPAPIHSLKN